MAGNNDAAKSNTRKRKIGEIKNVEKSNKCDVMFSKRKIGLFNKVTELSILCKARTALIIASPNKELHACGYPNCDAVIQQFLTGKDSMDDSEKKKQEEVVETLRLEYEAIEDKLTEEEKNLKAIIDSKSKSDSIFPCWWGDSIDDMDLESLEEFTTSLQNLRLNLSSAIDQKKLMFASNDQFKPLSNLIHMGFSIAPQL
ncbi:hypothetical protein P8452_42203 [Trifolium repens]|nr:hypothetical protein P8452_42203 [Trifolium repens]